MGHMTLTNDDRDYLDTKFNEIHTRITKLDNIRAGELHRITSEQNKKLSEVEKQFEVHRVTPCVDVKKHEETHHTIGVGKMIGAIAAIIGILGGSVALAAYFK